MSAIDYALRRISLNKLHDTGTLDVLHGAFGAGDARVEHVVSLLTAPESVTALRNLILLGKLLGVSIRIFCAG